MSPGPSTAPLNTAAPPATTSAQASPSVSRRVSQIMGPPPVPHYPTSPSLGVAMPASAGDNTGVGIGPGPLRHPRPLTVADLHLELEKEQEAVVNRLTRELSLLRQQTASVASTASSTSTNLNDPLDYQHPTPSRHRSSSNISSRSIAGATAGAIAGSVTSIAPSRDREAPSSSRPSLDIVRGSLSREASVRSRRQSGAASPSLSSSVQKHGENFPHHNANPHSQPHGYSHSHRPSLTSHAAPIPTSQHGNVHHTRSGSMSSSAGISRYEEAAQHRAELEAVKRENEALRRRVRELEASLKERQPQSPREGAGISTSSLTSSMRDASIADPPLSHDSDRP
ncbi:hypothetical protein FQN51_006174 [Onygenales sp. PD_10]|nr:hypothetical protein FQN51_006174 [Onygenales sp. PD_10]